MTPVSHTSLSTARLALSSRSTTPPCLKMDLVHQTPFPLGLLGQRPVPHSPTTSFHLPYLPNKPHLLLQIYRAKEKRNSPPRPWTRTSSPASPLPSSSLHATL